MQRFRRRAEEVNEDDSDWGALEDEPSSDEDADDSFKPQYGFSMHKGKRNRGPRPKGLGPHTQHKAKHQVMTPPQIRALG